MMVVDVRVKCHAGGLRPSVLMGQDVETEHKRAEIPGFARGLAHPGRVCQAECLRRWALMRTGPGACAPRL